VIAPNAISDVELADNAVDTAALQDGSVTDPKIVSMDAGKLTGDIAAARLAANLVAAWNALTGYTAGALTAGDLGAARMTAHVIDAINADPTGVIDAARAPGSGGGGLGPDTVGPVELGVTAGTVTNGKALVPDGSGQIDRLTVTGAATIVNTAAALNLAAHASATLGFFTATPAARQTVLGGAVTNNVTDPGVASQTTWVDYTPSTYGADNAAIKALLWQLTHTVSLLYAACRTYGLVN
jgi:hypothetical protein